MADKLHFDFIVNKEKNSITIVREFAAGIELVWDAWTKPELLDLWWAPKPWQSKTKSMDFTEGGKRVYAMCGPGGEEHWGVASFTSIVPLQHYAGVDNFADAEGIINPDFPEAHFHISFEKQNNHTLVTNATVYPSLEQLEASLNMGLKEGITMTMEQLDGVLNELGAAK
jgi:uncharacterized protein YndB with AHSA1/START domain